MYLPTEMKSLRIVTGFLCFTVLHTVRGGYVTDLGLPPDALDFTPKDANNNDFDFTPEEYKNANRRGDYEEHNSDDKKLPAPTSYASFKLESKDAVPVKIKVWKPAPKPELEWPQSPIWLQQDSGNHGSSQEDEALTHHPSPPQPHGGGGHPEEEDHTSALASHPPPAPPHSYGPPEPMWQPASPPSHGPPQWQSAPEPPSHGPPKWQSAPEPPSHGPPKWQSAPEPPSHGAPPGMWQPSQSYQPDQGYHYELMDRQAH